MASLYIAEFNALGGRGGFPAEIAAIPPIVEQKLAIGGSSTPSAAFNANTTIIRVHTDAICSLAFGLTPVATAANMRMAADQTEYFAVPPGYKIAVISNT